MSTFSGRDRRPESHGLTDWIQNSQRFRAQVYGVGLAVLAALPCDRPRGVVKVQLTPPHAGDLSSPDLNPIEQVFSKLKHGLRKAAGRSYDAILPAIGELLGSYTPKECANYVKNCGYEAV